MQLSSGKNKEQQSRFAKPLIDVLELRRASAGVDVGAQHGGHSRQMAFAARHDNARLFPEILLTRFRIGSI